MARDFANAFYKSRRWKATRQAYLKKVGGLCERCEKKGLQIPAEIVHHTIYLTPENIRDPKISLAFENLEAVCRKCHEEEHDKGQRRYKITDAGEVVIRNRPPVKNEKKDPPTATVGPEGRKDRKRERPSQNSKYLSKSKGKRREPDGNNWIYAYYQAIKEGSEPAGKWVRIIYEYLVRGIESGAFFFDQKKANAVIKWMESHCFHVRGKLAPGPLMLELFQKALLSAIYGIVDENGERVFWEVVLLIGRKDGKSVIASCNADLEFRTDLGVGSGYGSEIYCVAPKLDQAEIVYSTTWKMILLDPEYKDLKDHCDERDEHNRKINDDSMLPKKRRSEISIEGTNATIKKLAFQAKTADGFSPSLVICDEIAAWPGDRGLKMYEVLKSGTGERGSESLIMSTTTSGYENDGIFDELMKRSTRFLMGDSNERHLLPVLYMIDDPDKWNDVNEIRKAMPMLGKSIGVDFILNEIAVAEGSLSKKAEFLCKYCCIKQNSSQAWLNTTDVQKCFSGNQLHFEDFARHYAVCGLDLSQTTDLTAAICVIEKNEKLYVIAHFWMPAEKIEEATARDNVPYKAFVTRGFLTLSGENFVNYKDPYKWFTDLIEKYRIYPLKLGFDRWSAQNLIEELNDFGFQTDDVYQGENLTPVINEVDGLIRDGTFDCGDNDLLKAHMLNSALKLNNETNRKKLIKLSATSRIDGMAALLDAMTVRQKWWNEIGGQLKNAKR